MNRITNKQYLIDITIKSLQTVQPDQPTKARCEVHYADDSYLRIQASPMLRNGVGHFCDERLRIPYSSEVSIVFKLVKPNKKQSILGHYLLQIEKLLSEKQYYIKTKDKLEECQAFVDFQCRIIDKQLICQSDNQEAELEANVSKAEKSIITLEQKIHKIKVNRPLSEVKTPTIFKKNHNLVPMTQEEYCKTIREAENILKKKQLFSQRYEILGKYSRDKYGALRTSKIKALQDRLNESKRDKFNHNLIIYVIISVISFFIGINM